MKGKSNPAIRLVSPWIDRDNGQPTLPDLRTLVPHTMNDRKKLLKWLMVAAKLAVVALLIWAVRAALLKAFEDLRQHSWHVEPQWLVLSGVLYLLGTLPSGLFWHRLLLAADERLALGPALRAYYVSQVGKYVPGKAMVLILRQALIREARVSMTVVTAAVFFETLMNMADGSLMALVILLFQPTWDTTLILAALGMLLVTGLPTVPAIFRFAIKFSGVAKLNPAAFGKLYEIGPRVLAMGWLGMAAGWWVQGVSLWAVLRRWVGSMEVPWKICLFTRPWWRCRWSRVFWH